MVCMPANVPSRLAMKSGVSLAMITPLPSARSANVRIVSTTSGSVWSVGINSRSFRYLGGLKKCVPRKCALNASERPSASVWSGIPEVLDETIAAGAASFSTRCMSSRLGSIRSTIASMIQSASASRSRLSSKLPRRILSATSSPISAAGRALRMRSKPALVTASRSSPVGAATSSNSTSRPALAHCAAIAAPIVPAPRTATLRTGCVTRPPPFPEARNP